MLVQSRCDDLYRCAPGQRPQCASACVVYGFYRFSNLVIILSRKGWYSGCGWAERCKSKDPTNEVIGSSSDGAACDELYEKFKEFN